MYKVCGKRYSKAGHEASQPVTFFHSFILFFLHCGRGKKIIIRRNILKSEKKVPCENKISLFLLS